MAWIKTIRFANATGKLFQLYNRLTGPNETIDNIMLLHSLRPNTLEGHMALYKHILHHSSNTLSQWFLEAIGTYVSYLNKCDYCFEHHFVGLKRELNDDQKADAFRTAFTEDNLDESPFDYQEIAALNYAKKTHKNA